MKETAQISRRDWEKAREYNRQARRQGMYEDGHEVAWLGVSHKYVGFEYLGRGAYLSNEVIEITFPRENQKSVSYHVDNPKTGRPRKITVALEWV